MLMIMILTYKMRSNNSSNSNLKNQELLICKKPNLFIIEIRVQCHSKEEEVNHQETLDQKTNQININLLIHFKKVQTQKRDNLASKKQIRLINQATIKMKKKNFLLKINPPDPQCKNLKLQSPKQKVEPVLETKRKVL